MPAMKSRGNVLVLWNQPEEDIYERWREQGPRVLSWDPARQVPDVGTVAEEMDAMLRAIRAGGYRTDVVNIEDDLERLFAAIRLFRPDVVMNLVEYINDDAGQEAYVAGLYEMLGVAYTGSRPMTLATCQNKYRTKLLLEAAELPTAPYFLVEAEPVPRDHELEFPLIVKPAFEDASGGIEPASVVLDQDALEVQVGRVLREYQMPVLVEEYIEGREIHAALLGNDPPEVLPLFEMEFDDSEFNPEGEWRPQIISYRAKWDPHSPEFYMMDSVCPAEDLDEAVEEYIRDIAVRAFKALGCQDYARIDMRVDEEEGEAYILEVNPNPDLSDGAAYMQCVVASGRTFGQALAEILDMAMARARRAQRVGPAQANLPSDHLMREWVVSQRRGERTVLPVSGSVAGAAAGERLEAATGVVEMRAPVDAGEGEVSGAAGEGEVVGGGVEGGGVSGCVDATESSEVMAGGGDEASEVVAGGGDEASEVVVGAEQESGHASSKSSRSR
jgi:D-alanine-D-alanine ligase